ncbi:hypothetical protein QYE76_052412 [Lolium multiflorum]|uniref:Uncharacterized protein n=1 Tax=Lolium multiflorum TaxID=4521 RepID=A0AAD8WL12_LOLMU|nr:hypothetical protein QYE76_052412 [Lolium multiflorum]
MSMMGEMRFFLGFEIKQLREVTFIFHAKYIQDMLKRFNMKDLNSEKTPMATTCHLALDPGDYEKEETMDVKGKGVQGSSSSKLKKTTARKKFVGNPNPGFSV